MHYLPGWGNHHASEAVAGALPVGRNSPQHVPFGLYAEQLSGTAFTAPRHDNRRSWLYRMRPSAGHPPFRPYGRDTLIVAGQVDTPNRLRWNPLPAEGRSCVRCSCTGSIASFSPGSCLFCFFIACILHL